MTDIVGNRTIRTLWKEACESWGDSLFYIFEDIRGEVSQMTYGDFFTRVNQASNCFLRFGIQKGDRVVVQLHNSPEFLLCWFGLAQIGAVSVPINVQYTGTECAYILEKCRPKAVVAEEEFLPFYQNLDQSAPTHLFLARSTRQIPGVYNFRAELERETGQLSQRVPLSSDDVMEILFTSGTTAHPKGVVMTHCNALYAGIVHAWQCGLREGDRFLTSMPCFHIDFQFMAVMSAITVGGTVVIIEHFSARQFWRQVCRYQANVTDTMPMLIRTMMMQPREEWERENAIRQVYFSMGMSTEEKDAFEERFGVRLLNCYGSTETVSCVTGDPLYGPRRWPSVGLPAISYRIRVVDQRGREVPPGQPGEIQVHGEAGRSLMKEYYNDPENTARTLGSDGWLRTGDTGYLDEDGWLYFVDRHSNMIKRSGENISTVEVENVLTSHPGICEAAVFGIPDPIRDQAVKAVVRLAEGAHLTSEEIIAYCKSYLAAFKVPSVVEICQDYPRTCTGKIQKNLLH